MGRKFALVIGNTQYDDAGLSQLKAPEADMRALAELLKDPQASGFDEINTLFNRPFAEVHPAIADFFADKKPSDLLLFYFSGHGVLDEQGRLYLVLKNTRRNRLSGSAIQALFLKDEMDQCRSKQQVLILDCCHSGAFAEGAKGEVGRLAVTNSTFEGHGRFVLTATDKTQFAWEGDRLIGEVENSLFTHFLIEGLETGAADIDGDGRITLDELYDYIYPRVVEATPNQKPRKIVYDQQGEFVIFKNPRPREIMPTKLPLELRQAIESPLASVREAAAKELERLLNGSVPGLALSAHNALKHLAEDDSRRVANAASATLSIHEAREAKKEAERQAREEAGRLESEWLAAEKAKQEQLAKEHAEAERKAKEEAELKEQEEAEQLERERLAAEKAKQEQLAKERAEAMHKAKEEARRLERQRLAAEATKQEQLVKARAEAERKAKEEAELKERNEPAPMPAPTPARLLIAASNKKSPIVAALLSFFLFGGAGQIYLGQWKKGLVLVVATLFLSFFLIGGLIGIIGVGDAYGIARKLRQGISVGEWEFSVNWKVVGIVTVIYFIVAIGLALWGGFSTSR